MTTYSARAECTTDALNFFAKLSIDTFTVKKLGKLGADIAFELETSAPLEVVRVAALAVPDGHVIVETLRAVPLSQNSLERKRLKS